MRKVFTLACMALGTIGLAQTSNCDTIMITKDTHIWNQDVTNSGDIHTHEHLNVVEWTRQGGQSTKQPLLDYDLSSLPTDITIQSAELMLFADESPTDGSHSTHSGPNDVDVYIVTEAWAEDLGWDNTPSNTFSGVTLPASTSGDQDYTVDLTDAVIDQYENPGSYHGILLKMQDPNYYRSMIFASSENADASKHPYLEVCYITDDTTGQTSSVIEVEKAEKNFVVYPNSASSQVSISSELQGEFMVTIIDMSGRVVHVAGGLQGEYSVDVTALTAGTYVVNIVTENGLEQHKVIVQ